MAERGEALPQNWLPHGFYKIRARANGHWIPIQITLEDGDRDPETWELLSDQWLSAVWYPQADNTQGFSVNPKRFFGRAFKIEKEEFEWLLALRTIPRRYRLRSSQ